MPLLDSTTGHETHKHRGASVPPPQPWRRNLKQVVVGVAEVHAHVASGPLGPAFQGDAMLLEVLLPWGEFVALDRERDVDGT